MPSQSDQELHCLGILLNSVQNNAFFLRNDFIKDVDDASVVVLFFFQFGFVSADSNNALTDQRAHFVAHGFALAILFARFNLTSFIHLLTGTKVHGTDGLHAHKF